MSEATCGTSCTRMSLRSCGLRSAHSSLDWHDRRFARPPLPAMALELGFVMLLLGPAEAEIGNKAPARRQVECGAGCFGIEDRDPADAEPFGACRKPQGLNRRHHGITKRL